MEFTNRYNLSKLESGDNIADEDYKFTFKDRDIIDYLTYLGAEGHVHDGEPGVDEDPDTPLSYTLLEGTGNIPAGVTAYYRYSYVDVNGAETAASPQVSVVTTPPLSPPAAPVLSRAVTGGTLLPGNYSYVVTAWETANTNETIASGSTYITIAKNVTTGEITIQLPDLPTGADGFNIYKRGPGSIQFFFLDSIDMTVVTPPTEYVDDGLVTVNVARTLPVSNSSNSGNSVELTLPGATPTVPEGYTWKVYRTYQEGDWENSLLSWVVEETVEGSGIISPTYTDTGGQTLQGMPSETSTIVGSPSKIDLTAHVEGILPLANLPIIPISQAVGVFIVTFGEPGPLVAETGSQLWVCEFEEAEILWCRAYLGRDSVPSATDVIVDVNRYSGSTATPTWDTIYTTQANRPRVTVGMMIGDETVPDVTTIYRGDALTIDIDQTGGGATPTDENLTLNVYLRVTETTLDE